MYRVTWVKLDTGVWGETGGLYTLIQNPQDKSWMVWTSKGAVAYVNTLREAKAVVVAVQTVRYHNVNLDKCL